MTSRRDLGHEIDLHDDEEGWPPKRICSDCNLLISTNARAGRQSHIEYLANGPHPATFVMTDLAGLQWFACDAHAKLPVSYDRKLCGVPLPIADFWEQVRATDAADRLKGTWRPE